HVEQFRDDLGGHAAEDLGRYASASLAEEFDSGAAQRGRGKGDRVARHLADLHEPCPVIRGGEVVPAECSKCLFGGFSPQMVEYEVEGMVRMGFCDRGAEPAWVVRDADGAVGSGLGECFETVAVPTDGDDVSRREFV